MKKILIVDDSIIFSNVVKKILTAAKYEVESVDNGAGALQSYYRFKPDIVLLDISMPIMDGKETLRKLLTLDRNAKVIMATAVDDGQSIQKYIDMGAVGYITKPYNRADLITAIENSKHLSSKNTRTFFAIVRNRIELVIRNMFDPSDSLILKGVTVLREDSTQHTIPFTHTSSIVAVPEIKEPFQIKISPESIGYITKFGGQQSGAVVSIIKLKEQGMVGVPYDIDSSPQGSTGQKLFDALEFFNIINQKILSEYSNFTNSKFERELVRVYDESKEMSASWKTIVQATFDIVSHCKTIEIKILFCLGT